MNIIQVKPITVEMVWWKICNGGRSAMVFQYHCRSSGGEVCNGGEGLQYNTGTIYGPKKSNLGHIKPDIMINIFCKVMEYPCA